MKLIIHCLWIISIGQFCNGYDPKIVSGTNALPGQYPYAVSVRYYQTHECGGSIIGSKWILTAAHCIYPDYIDVATILYGTIYLQNGESPEGNTAQVLNAYSHENYIPSGGYENDIALLELKENLEFNAYVQPISLPQYADETPSEIEAVLVGWGYPQTNGDVMQVLQTVIITIFSDNTCSEIHENYNSAAHICAGVVGGGKGQCSGDSGGALAVNNTQYGIVSWSNKPCATSPGVLTRVATYRQWIHEKTQL